MTVSGLSREHRHEARDIITHAALLVIRHRDEIHYTQDYTLRWEGINKHLVAAHGHFPRHADCSAMVAWCEWQALQLRFNLGDIVNHDHWRGGFTGTMAGGGREVLHLKNVLRADYFLYGPGPNHEHTTMCVGHEMIHGVRTPMVMSHGSEAGPLYLPYNYRSDLSSIRRVI